MGKEVTGTSSGFIEAVGNETETHGCSGSTSTADSTADSGRTADGRTDGRTTETEKEKSVVVSVLTEEQERQRKREERNAKRRERYAKEKAENGQPVKPRKVNGTKKSTTNVVDSSQIATILATISTIIASRPNMAHWQLTPNEIQQLANPIGNMMSKSEAFAQLGEHADAIALVTAVFTIAVPRVVISLSLAQQNKEKKQNVTGVEKPVRTGRKQEQKQTGENPIANPDSNKSSSVDGTDNGQADAFVGNALEY